MTMIYDKKARKEIAKLTINSDLLKQAYELGIDISSCVENILEHEVKQQKICDWKNKNKHSIILCNNNVETKGVFSDTMRCF